MISPPVLIIGAGGHARVVLDALHHGGWTIAGLVDADHTRHGGVVLGYPLLGDDSVIDAADPSHLLLANGIGALGNAALRRRIQLQRQQQGFTFPVIVHPRAVIGLEVALGQGTQIMAGAVIQPGCTLGDGTIVNTGAHVDHDCYIGAFSHVAPGAILAGGVVIGENVHLGLGAVVLEGRTIGDGAVIGAGAVVVKDVDAGVKVVGVPAKERKP